MRKLIVLLHTSLDGFVAGINGEMDWIKVDDEMFEVVGGLTKQADAALYGRVTYEMMDSYWPTAGERPGASKHDIEHAGWYNRVHKIVVSATKEGITADKTTFIGSSIPTRILELKEEQGENILLIGSPSVVHLLLEYNLIDDYWLFINPVILGKGIPLYTKIDFNINLKLQSSNTFPCGVVGLNYIASS